VTLTGTPGGSLECDFTFTGLYVIGGGVDDVR